jgi:uroporphyrinogen III methyltransferase/synthase
MGLEAVGARVIECPAIAIEPVNDWTEVDRVASNLHTYDWLIFTSSNTVEFFMRRMRYLHVTCCTPIAVIGSGTAQALRTWDLEPSRIPPQFRAESLVETFPADMHGIRVLIPRAETAREILPEELRRRGATVDVVTVYRTVKAAGLSDLREHLKRERIDAVVFTSPTAVRYFREELGEDLVQSLGSIPIAVIGPVAREAVAAAGLEAVIEPKRATIQDLIQAIRSYFSNREAST